MNHCSFLKGNICPLTFCGFKSLLSLFYCLLFGWVFQIPSEDPCEWLGSRRSFLTHLLWEGSTATQLLPYQDQWHYLQKQKGCSTSVFSSMFKWAKHKNQFFTILFHVRRRPQDIQKGLLRYRLFNWFNYTVKKKKGFFNPFQEEKGFFSLKRSKLAQHKFREKCPLPEATTKGYF